MKRIFLLFFLLPLWCMAQIPKPKPGTYVHDYAAVLTDDQVYQLNLKLRELENQTTVQAAILLIDHLPSGWSIEDYARTVGNNWKVGVNHNGMVYVAALNEHRQRLEIAERLEGAIPDITAARIIDNLQTDLRNQNYYEALDLFITQIEQELGVAATDAAGPPPELVQPPSRYEAPVSTEQSEYEREKARYNSYRPYITVGIIAGAVVFIIWAYRYRKRYVRENTINGIYIGAGSAYYASTHPGSGGDAGGSGFGGFGSGGGGGFSGGGASGSW